MKGKQMNQEASAALPLTRHPPISAVGYRGFFAWCAAEKKQKGKETILFVTVGGESHFGVLEGFDPATSELALNRGGAYGLFKVKSDDLAGEDSIHQMDTGEYLRFSVAGHNASSGRRPRIPAKPVDPHYWVSHDAQAAGDLAKQ